MNATGLFFVNGGVLSLEKSVECFLPFEKTVQQLQLELINQQKSSDYRIAECKTAFSSEKLQKLGFTVFNVKNFLVHLNTDQQAPILRAWQWLTWNKQAKYCGQCGSLLESAVDAPQKTCTACDAVFFPRFSPAIMVLIQRDDKILLARSAHFPKNRYSALAGFVDLGESAEQAVHREVKEEVGLRIKDLVYFGTQPWPFPDSFMIAFKATYHSGEIVIDANEIEDARWFSLNDLPELPSYASISRLLIDSLLSG